MKICFIGLGSIGTRHLRNVTGILSERDVDFEIHALRSSNRLLLEDVRNLINKEITSYDDLDDDYDITFITNPTDKHYKTLKNILPKTKNIFIEKPLFMNTGIDPKSLHLNPSSVYYVAAPLRYNRVFATIEDFVKKNHVYSARAICSSYLPDWRKNIDYRKNYSARKDMGGGVSLDLIHEWDYLKHLFGMPNKLSYLKGTVSNLEIDSDDIAIYIAEYSDKLVELHLDYFGRRPVRKLDLFTDAGTFEADFIKGTATFDNGTDVTSYPIPEQVDPYVKEMNYFLDLCSGTIKENQNDIYNAYDTLKLALGEIK